jgi:hypothetical protein
MLLLDRPDPDSAGKGRSHLWRYAVSDELVDFLRARLDDDEKLARAASPGPWHVDEDSDEILAVDGIVVAEGFALSGRQLRATIQHIARHDPARVLAEVDTRRRILGLHAPRGRDDGCVICDAGNGSCGCMGGDWEYPCDTVKLLALTFADHPDYRDEWRP